MDYVLETEHLSKRYRHFTALDDLEMHVEKGAIYGFVGRNGAGKTTLIRLISGLQYPTGGTYCLYGTPHTHKGIHAARRRMGSIVETPSVYPNLSAYGNMALQYDTLGVPSYSGIKDALTFVGLHDTGNKRAKNFSLGMRQRLGIAVALAGNPDFVVLDEPINGLDPEGIVEIRELILKLNRERETTVLISSHILGELSKLATHYGFIDHGHIVKEISAAELEQACRKCMRVEVTDVNILSRILETENADYKILSANSAEIYGEIPVSRLATKMAAAGAELLKVYEHDEDLETYFINLLGGAQ